MGEYKKSQYNLLYDYKHNEKVIYNTRTLSLSMLNEQEYSRYVHFENEDVNLENENLFKSLYEDGFIIDYECDELSILKHRLNISRYSKDSLRLTIAPTMDCNFNCFYCYEKGRNLENNDYMSYEIQEKLINFIKKRSDNIKVLDIVWYGGEPLLEFEIIKDMSKRIIELCSSNNINYNAMIVSNGYLLKNFEPKEFLDIGINTIQITIDGPEKIHNERRTLLNGGETYLEIIRNITNYQDHMDIVIRINLDKINANYLEDLVKNFKKYNIHKPIFNLAPVTNYNNPTDETCLTTEEFVIFSREFNNICKRYGIQSKSNIASRVSSFCDADSLNAFVVDNKGYIYKCWQNIGVKSLSINNLVGDNKKNSTLYFDYMAYDATEDNRCKQCVYLPICMGGCPHNRRENLERCTFHKYMIEDMIGDMIEASFESSKI